MKRQLNKFNNGFTLVELLVVVSIIAILSVIGLTVFTSAQQNARDARRRADIDAIASALESTRNPGVAFYTSLPITSFAGGKVPKDSYTTEKYCLLSVVDPDTKINDPPTWENTICPSGSTTAPVDGKTVTYTGIPDTGIASDAVPFGTSSGSNNVTAWKVCAKLESGSFYCKPSAQ